MPTYRTGVVSRVLHERRGLQRVEVDGHAAYVLTQLTGPVAAGDRVVVNTTAVELGLGTGGAHVVHWNLARDELTEPGPGHIMKLRYTSLQVDAGAAEERLGPQLPEDLGGMPVVACGLHSQLAPVAAAFKHTRPAARLAYVMTDGGALPLALSDLVADLQATGLIDLTVTTGHAFGGDHEAVTLHSGLLVARASGADAVVAGIGPGVVGTGTRYGTTGLDVAAVIDAAVALGGQPVVAARWSDADSRERHRGLSHHTATALAVARSQPLVPNPDEVAVPDMAGLLARHGLAVTTMGRGPDQEPGFFRWAGAAGVAAAGLLGPGR